MLKNIANLLEELEKKIMMAVHITVTKVFNLGEKFSWNGLKMQKIRRIVNTNIIKLEILGFDWISKNLF